MNSAPTPDPVPARDAELEVTAAQWVVRSREGLDAEAQQALAAWRAGDPRREDAFLRLTAMADALQRARRMGAADAIVVELKTRARRRRIRRGMLACAAMATALIWSAGWWGRSYRSESAIAQTQLKAGAAAVQRLEDGSIVELHGNAEIVVRFEPGVRRVQLLRGEALFSVTKNPNRPFIVRAHGVDVVAVGTAFDVRLQPRAVEVLVTEGKVRLDGSEGGESLLPETRDGRPALLVAGQRAVVDAKSPRSAEVSQVAPDDVSKQLAWRDARLEFTGVELARAVGQMNQRNRTQVCLENEEMGRFRIHGTFAANDPETFSRLVAETFGLEAVPDGADRILLKQSLPPRP